MEVKKAAIEDSPDDIPNLVAEILARRVETRLRRSLHFGYQSRREVMTRVRGRILHLDTERNKLLQQGKIACRFDEFTVNTIRNRFVRAALLSISTIVKKDENLVRRCRTLALQMYRMGVIGERPSRSEISIDRFSKNDRDDQMMVVAAKLAFDLTLPTEKMGVNLLSSPDRESQFWKIFEKGIAGFYDAVLPGNEWEVQAGKRIYWNLKQKSSRIEKFLPSMILDIVLTNSSNRRKIVIDTKSNHIFVKGQHREKSLHSAYIYQIYAYLRSQETSKDLCSLRTSGLLLHLSLDEDVDEAVVIQGYEIRFATVNLMGKAAEIRKRLQEVIQEFKFA